MNAISRQSRILGIDAARGTAMALVCLSHIKEHFVTSAPEMYLALMHVTRIATPTFLLLSGFVIGYVLRNSARPHVRLTFVDRGLFLLLVAHWLIGLSDLRSVEFSQWVFSRALIIDAIGISLLVAVCVRLASAAALAFSGAAIAVFSWILGMTLEVESPVLRGAADLLFNLRSVSNTLVDIALMPYLGVFVIGMALSKRLNVALRARDEVALAKTLCAFGATAIGLVACAIIAWPLTRAWVTELGWAAYDIQLLRQTLDPRFKWPPSPAYLLLYGGAGLLLAAWFLWSRPARWMKPVTAVMAVPGRAALMCFVVQDWMLRLLPPMLGFDQVASIAFWWIYLLGTLLLLYGLSRWWDRHNGNRWLTVGLKWLANRYEQRWHAWAHALHWHRSLPRRP